MTLIWINFGDRSLLYFYPVFDDNNEIKMESFVDVSYKETINLIAFTIGFEKKN